ncbi:MAG: hypothetical protein KA138_03720 [Saprospiraceae bacterium]|nr:hypothetical protein [Saprospiraceae bacterium]
MNHRLLFSLFLTIPSVLSAQVVGFSEGKNLAELRAAVFAKDPPLDAQRFLSEPLGISQDNIAVPTLNPVFLPKWSSKELPFFCKIEHNWGKKARLPLKFRLGSVEYVDWLEGKL